MASQTSAELLALGEAEARVPRAHDSSRAAAVTFRPAADAPLIWLADRQSAFAAFSAAPIALAPPRALAASLSALMPPWPRRSVAVAIALAVDRISLAAPSVEIGAAAV